MEFAQIIELVSFFAGMLIQFILMGQLLKRRKKNRTGILFFFLMLSIGLWHFGLFTTYFLEILFGPDNPDVFIITSSFSIFVVMGLTLMPSVLLHGLVSFFFDRELNFNARLRFWIEWAIYIVYFPLLFFPIIMEQLFVNTAIYFEVVLAPYQLPFALWLMATLLMASVFCFKLSRVGWEKEERNLFFSMGFCFFFIVGILGVLIWPSFLPKNSVYTDGFLLIVSLLPTLVLSYYIYKYNYMDFIIRRSILYLILITTVVLLYLCGIQKLTYFVEQRYEINGPLIESLLILTLVFTFRPFRAHTAEMLDRFFFKEHQVYKTVYRDLTQQIRGGKEEDMPALMQHIVETLKKNMDLDHASLVFFEKQKDSLRISASSLPFQVEDFASIVRHFSEYKVKILHKYEIDEKDVIHEMNNLGAVTIIPIYSDQELIGLFSLGKKSNNKRIHSDELEILVLLSNQLTTEIKNMQLLEQKFRLERELLENEKYLALGRLSASVAHQVKNPLSSIKIIAQVLREDLPPDDHREEDLTLVINEVDKLARVVNQLLEFAKPAKQTLQQANLSTVVDEVAILMQYEASKYNIQIKKEIPLHIPKLKADRMTLQDIFSNLIQNSIHALEKKGDEIYIKAYYPALLFEGAGTDIRIKKNMVTVAIRDNGCGISDKNMKNIFEPFYTTKQQGTGLGIPIVLQRLKSMGGKLKIESSMEEKDVFSRGTTVFLWLPVVL